MQTQYEHLSLDPASRRNPWEAGALTRLPWPGLTALFGALVGIIVSISILVLSNGIPIAQWSFQPTVYLSITSTITNILLAFALSEGVVTAWWARALTRNTNVADLHHRWAVGNSFLAAVTSGRNFNLVAVASILVALAPINGPFLQKASRVVVRTVATNVTLNIRVAPEIPDGFTGFLEGRGHIPSLLSQSFTPIVSNYYDRTLINVTGSGCNGICSTTVIGAGFAISCSRGETTFDLTPVLNSSTEFSPVDVFDTKIDWLDDVPGELDLQVKFKPNQGCSGILVQNNCTLKAATVRYRVVIDGIHSSISLATDSTIYDDEVVSINDVRFTSRPGDNTTLGGLKLALYNRLGSTATIRWAGAIGYEISTLGATAHQFVVFNSAEAMQCSRAFSDPTDNMLANMRELTFRTAVGAANSSSFQQVQATQVATDAVYVSNFLYLGLAILVTLLAVLSVVPTFYGYWYLGRKVSMSPVEIAKAFNAPMLRSQDSNAEAKQLIKEMGAKNVRYGSLSASYRSIGTFDAASTGDQKSSLHRHGYCDMRLEIAPQGEVVGPQEGWKFGG